MAKQALLAAVEVQCPTTNTTVRLTAADVDWSGYAAECELCGEHGDVRMAYRCTACGKTHEITLKEW